MAEHKNEAVFLISKGSFFAPNAVVKGTNNNFFKISDELTSFILRVVGAGGATHWLTQFVVTAGNNLCNWIEPGKCDLEDSWAYDKLPNYLAVSAFTLALNIYIYRRAAPYSPEKIVESIGQQVRQITINISTEFEYVNDEVEAANYLRQQLLEINKQLNLLPLKEKMMLFSSLKQLNKCLQETNKQPDKMQAMTVYSEELKTWLRDNKLESLLIDQRQPLGMQPR